MVTQEGLFIVYQICCRQCMVVENDRMVVQDTGGPREVPLYTGMVRLCEGSKLYI